MHELLKRLIKAVYQYERELDRLRSGDGMEKGHTSLVEKIARRYGRTKEEKIFIMETLVNFRDEEFDG